MSQSDRREVAFLAREEFGNLRSITKITRKKSFKFKRFYSDLKMGDPQVPYTSIKITNIYQKTQ
jgi:hypothetical protein